MSRIREIWFISDLHLNPAFPQTTALFSATMEKLKQAPVDALYILGDLFEVWIGDDDQNDFNQTIASALKDVVKSGIPVHFLHGNRDFLIGRKFLQQVGCRILTEKTRIDVFGKSVLLMHGDTLCTEDLAYMRARKWLRNPVVKTLFLLLPLTWRKKIANYAREKSHAHVTKASFNIMDVTQDEVVKVMHEENVNFLVHGHTHKPDMHYFNDGRHEKNRIVLGAWHEQASVLTWNNKGEKALRTFKI